MSEQIQAFKHARHHSDKRCFICGEHMHQTPERHCFAHMLPKGRYPDLKNDSNNIKIVCSVKCHHDLDRLTAGKRHQIYKQVCIGNSPSLEDIKLL